MPRLVPASFSPPRLAAVSPQLAPGAQQQQQQHQQQPVLPQHQQQPQPQLEPQRNGSLPPGWKAVWDADTASWYYADLEARSTAWDPPPAHQHGDWSRLIDVHDQAYWSSAILGLSFFERGGEWNRLLDKDGRHYWSCPQRGLRFFEDG